MPLPNLPRPLSKPEFVAMADPILVDHPPTGARWAHEIKWDGWRAQAHLDQGKPTIYTRKGYNWTTRFKSIAAAIAKLPVSSAILDGEVVAIDAEGRPDFHAVRSEAARLAYKAFDLLWLDGKDLRPLPWSARKARLKDLFKQRRPQPVLSYVEAIHDDGPTVFASACKLSMEGIVSKRIDSPYRAGRSDTWLKCRCAITETVAVIGFSTTRDSIDGLYLARAEDGRLVYVGKVENGLTAAAVKQLEAKLRPLVAQRSTIKIADRPKAIPVAPKVLVDISYPAITGDGRLRHPRFKRLRDDLTPGE